MTFQKRIMPGEGQIRLQTNVETQEWPGTCNEVMSRDRREWTVLSLTLKWFIYIQ